MTLIKSDNQRLFWDCLVKVLRPDTISMVYNGERYVWLRNQPKNEFEEIVWPLDDAPNVTPSVPSPQRTSLLAEVQSKLARGIGG